MSDRFVIHQHWLVRDHRSPSPPIRHSHTNGAGGHLHPTFGPSFYGYGSGDAKVSKRPLGVQLDYIQRPDADAFFDVILCDGALIGTPNGMRLLTDEDLENDPLPGYARAGSSVVERMEFGFDLTARFYDLRTSAGRERATLMAKQGLYLKSASEIGAW